MQKRLTLIFNHFEEEHLGKDVFLVPKYLGRRLNASISIVYPETKTNKKFPKNIDGIDLIPLRFKKQLSWFPLWRTWNFYKYLITNAKSIDFLMRFHLRNPHSVLMGIIYKFINPKGFYYLKLDIDPISLINLPANIKNGLKNYIEKKFISAFHNSLDLCSCETSLSYKLLHDVGKINPFYNFGDKLKLMPNGFDEDLLNSLKIKEKYYIDKENIFITVGRLGTPQKKTDIILQALASVDMKNWKFYLIGPIEDSFKPCIEDFFNRYPEKRDSVIFTGPIYEKKELWEYYNISKVFVLTSAWESYALVLNEAKRFRNFMLSTDVGAFGDLSESGKYGYTIEHGSYKSLSKAINDIINEDINIDVYNNYNKENLSWENMIKKLGL